MNWPAPFAAALSRIGRHGTSIAAGAIFVGLAVPPLAAAVFTHFLLGRAVISPSRWRSGKSW